MNNKYDILVDNMPTSNHLASHLGGVETMSNFEIFIIPALLLE